MNKINVPITLNMDQRLNDEVLKVNQYDTNIWELSITLIKDGVTVTVTDLSARMWCSKPDGTHVYKNCTISGGKIIADAGGQMFTAAGGVYCEIELSSASQTLGSPKFCINVAKSVKDEGAAESQDDFVALQQALSAALEAAQSAENDAEIATEAKTAAAASANTTTSDRTAAASSAASALASAQAAAAAVDLQIIDDTTGTHYQFGANNGLIYLEEVQS